MTCPQARPRVGGDWTRSAHLYPRSLHALSWRFSGELKLSFRGPLLLLVNSIIPTPPAAPRITSKPPSVVHGSFGPTAVTAPPGAGRGRPSGPVSPRGSVGKWIALAALIAGSFAAAYLAFHRAPPKTEIVSGRAGLKHTKSGQVERWWRDRVTVTLDGSLSSLSPAARDTVEEAFGAWVSSDAKIPRLAFDARDNKGNVVLSPDGENRIYYAPIRVPGHEGDLAITLGYTNDATGEIVEADMIVNSLRPFALLAATTGSTPSTPKDTGGNSDHKGPESSKETTGEHAPAAAPPAPSCAETYDFRSIVTHEAGHFFGLGEDMTDSSATMYYSTPPCDLRKRDLKSDDTEQVSSLYAVTPDGAPSSDETVSAQKCEIGSLGRRARGAPSAGLLTALALSAIAARRRRR
jgi:hypothetical protein